MKTILFICTGNICRSPMAEYLLRDKLGEDTDWKVGSAGVSAWHGMPASAFAVGVLEEKGIDLRPHRSQPLTKELVDSTNLIVVMTTAHRDEVRRRHMMAWAKIFRLHDFGAPPEEKNWDVKDPIGLSEEVYREIRDEIDASIVDLMKFLHKY